MLRARGTNSGSWERFYVVPQGGDQFALKSAARFTFVPVGGAGDTGMPPLSSVTASGRHDIASWNVCANNNTSAACKLQYADGDTVGANVAPGVDGYLSHRPEAISFQEICEKAVKPLELELETRLGAGWDVRFAPTYYKVVAADGTSGTGLMAQKTCADSTSHKDRGSFGIALAVKDTNTWYRGYTPFLGGDLNTTHASVDVLSSLYASHQECNQPTPGSPRDGGPHRRQQQDRLSLRPHRRHLRLRGRRPVPLGPPHDPRDDHALTGDAAAGAVHPGRAHSAAPSRRHVIVTLSCASPSDLAMTAPNSALNRMPNSSPTSSGRLGMSRSRRRAETAAFRMRSMPSSKEAVASATAFPRRETSTTAGSSSVTSTMR